MSPPLAPSARRLSACLVVLALGGCAYYNTFYLAKRHYGDAQKAQEKAGTDAPVPEAIGKYDATIRQCNKVLTDHAKSKWVDDAAYLLGASLYGKGEYQDAIRKLREFREKYPSSPFAPEARFTEGLAHFRQKEYPVADSILREVDSAYPKFPRRWALLYYGGETQAAMKQYPEAVVWYRRAFDAGERRRDRGLALTRMGDALVAAERFDSAGAVYDHALRVEDRPKQKFEIALRRGEVFKKLKRHEEALEHYRDMRPLAPAERREGELELRINECLGLTGRHEEAIAGYRDLVLRYPRTATAYEAQFQIGYLYESALTDFEAAAREYEKLKTEPPSTFADQAARRSRNLSSLREYRQRAESDTTQARARAAFLLAELYYFQLDKPDSAFLQYEVVEREFPTSPYAPKAGYARLWIAAQDRGDTAAAAALTDSVAKRYRGSRYVESALYLWKRWSGRVDDRTALLDSLTEKPDTSTASLYREPEPEPEPLDTVATVVPGLTPAQRKAQLDSLQEIRVRLLKEGKAPYRRRKQALPGEFIDVPESLIATPPPPADTLRAPADTTGASAVPVPSDTTRTAPPAGADSARVRREAPPDTNLIRVVPGR